MVKTFNLFVVRHLKTQQNDDIMRIFVVILLGFLVKHLIAQTYYKTENDSFLYWQPNVKIKYNDYKGDTTAAGMDLCRKYKIHNIGVVNIQYILDIPKKESKRGKLLEKAYIAPVFCKHGVVPVSMSCTAN
jgi:hypothetical protein